MKEIPVTNTASRVAEIVSRGLCSFGHFLVPTKSWTAVSQQHEMAPYPNPVITHPMENESWLSAIAKTAK